MSDELSEFYGNVGSGKRASASKVNATRGRDDILENPGNVVSADGADGESRWSESDGLFWRAKKTHGIIPPGLYNCVQVDGIGPALRRQELNTDDLLVLPEKNSESIFNEFERFWTLEELFKAFGYLYKRGFLLWGPPGSGKTSLINLMMKTIIQRYNGIIVIVEDPDNAAACLSMVRKNEPTRPLITILEDLDALVERWGEAGYLNLLDGSEQINNVIHIGTCFTPETRFLTADLRWVPCGELRVGDELWAFDEARPSKKGNRRRFRKSVVTMSHPAIKECVRVILNTGETFICTADHPWLAYRNRNTDPLRHSPRHGWHLDWIQASNILDCGLVRPFQPWDIDASYDAGWLAGILDGEGSLATHRTAHGGPSNVSVAQNIGPIADRIAKAVLQRVDAHVYPRKKNRNQQQVVDTRGGLAAALSLIGQVRAERLINRADLSGGMMHNKFPSHVIAVEPVGLREIQSIETSTHTYIAEGFACHNTNYPERLDKRFVDRPSRFDTVVKIGMPGWDAREMYFRSKFEGKNIVWWNDEELARWTKLAKGFSVAHMREMIISVCCLGQELETVVNRLVKMHERKPTSDTDPDAPPVGFHGSSSNIAQSRM